MKLPSLSPEEVQQVSALVAEYISNQRMKYIPRSVALSVAQRRAMAGFFSLELLVGTRLLVLEGERIQNPDFYPMLRSLGFDNLPDQTMMGAVTFVDTVVSHGSFQDGLLFHELVHVEQYRQLGIANFSALYVCGFLMAGGYDGIPLERNAYMLGERFETGPTVPFSVEKEVAKWIAEGRF